jgi:Zn-dependent protease/CBS domain-containing protein
MHGGFRFGRLFGIDLTVDYSWLFIFLLIAWNLTSLFATSHPSWGLAGALALAVVAAIVFFASIVVHELAHALVAMYFGGKVSSIRLFLFGGVSNLEREPKSPKAELLMALAGPATSLGIGVLFLAIASFFTGAVYDSASAQEAVAKADPISVMLLWLGPVNIALGLFNLVPGFPLDGGRVLRSILWSATHDLHKATRWASWVGQAIGWCLIAIGVAVAFGLRLPFVGRGLVAGLWLAFIGWFLHSAAQASWQQLLVQDVLEGVTVGRLMRRGGNVYVVPPDITVSTLVEGWFMRAHDRAFPVVNGQELLGVVTTTDVSRIPQAEWATTTVRAIMTAAEQTASVTPRDDLASAMRLLAQSGVEEMPVLEPGTRLLVGVLDRRDIARWLELRLSSDVAGRPLHGSHAG